MWQTAYHKYLQIFAATFVPNIIKFG